ncbi:hypothetical protein DL240_02955 [Lujinxingia litoralis]|uniref:G domain-containing protein n=1 Tax=Lujinxingia litoralis TaxID=2211119 RepID=A0A328CBF6_9DELT|nr:GTPase [Lujinxingia litoralis]RAL25184.1 hypothetical protein DL240_02955 [Lujinxingia litoralis]
MTLREELTEQVMRIEEMLDKVPEPVARKLRDHLKELRELLFEQRPPRFVLVGRRGAGKSSLVNAIFGESVAEVGHEKATTGRGTWWSYQGALGTLELLDTRGLQEGSTPAEAEQGVGVVASISEAIEQKAPDALLFLIKAKEVDAAVDADLDGLEAISGLVRRHFGFPVPVVAVITHCDELEPKNVRLHEPEQEDDVDLQEKLARVQRIEQDLYQKMRGRDGLRDQLVGVHGVSAYQSWRRDGTRRADERWRIEELLDFLLDELPEQARVEFVRLSQVRALQHRMADRLTAVVAGIAAGVALTPIPLADIGPITSLQVSLVVGIGYVAGRKIELRTAAEFLGAIGANVGAAMALREVARGLLKVMPGLGSAGSAAIAFAGTRAVGQAAAAYFIDGVNTEKARKLFKKKKKDAEDEYHRTIEG